MDTIKPGRVEPGIPASASAGRRDFVATQFASPAQVVRTHRTGYDLLLHSGLLG